MSYNYFRNLKRQPQVDNRPKYLRYGDVFLSNRNNNKQQQNKYNDVNSSYNSTDYANYNNINGNQYDNTKYNNRNGGQYDNTDYSKYSNKNCNQYDNTGHTKYNDRNCGQYGTNFATATMTKEQVSNLEAANIDRIRTTNQLNRNNDYDSSSLYYDDIDYSKPSRSREQRIYEYETNSNDVYDNYLFNTSNSRVNYQKRQLPPLQQKYSSRNSQYDLQYDNKYWDDYNPYQSKLNSKKQEINGISFKFIWQKFIITFTSVLSIVCMAWIAYHWHNTASPNTNKSPELVEPDKPSFKVLPDTPGGIDIPYQDKSIYSRVDPTFNQKIQEQLQIPQDVPVDIPTTPMPRSIETTQIAKTNKIPIEEYSIVDEKDYYVKCPIDGDKTVAIKQLNLLKKKLSTFPDNDMLENTTCAIRTVANTQGKRGKFILIGPFCDDNTAKQIGHFCKIKGEIISVKKTSKN